MCDRVEGRSGALAAIQPTFWDAADRRLGPAVSGVTSSLRGALLRHFSAAFSRRLWVSIFLAWDGGDVSDPVRAN